MKIVIQWVEGNKYAAWLIDEEKDIHVFLGYHFVYENLPLFQVQENLEKVLITIRGI